MVPFSESLWLCSLDGHLTERTGQGAFRIIYWAVEQPLGPTHAAILCPKPTDAIRVVRYAPELILSLLDDEVGGGMEVMIPGSLPDRPGLFERHEDGAVGHAIPTPPVPAHHELYVHGGEEVVLVFRDEVHHGQQANKDVAVRRHEERVRLRDPFNCLRGISWSAMAWVTYQTGEHALRNEDTFRKVSAYLDLGFLRSLFDPHVARGQ